VFGPEVFEAWVSAGCALGSIPEIGADELARRLGERTASIVDVRSRGEWASGHIPGAESFPLGELPDHLGELPPKGTVVVQCQGGGRSAIAASLLRRHGRDDVLNLAGGISEWSRAGLPVERHREE
jgi:hydroxyacylglutathione hydrolase